MPPASQRNRCTRECLAILRWWSWTAPATGLVLVTTTGSDYDTLLAIYTGTSLSNLLEVASSDDDDPANAVLTSSLSFQAEAGHTYQVAVDGFDGAMGNLQLSLGYANLSLSDPAFLPDGTFSFLLNALPGRKHEVLKSRDLSTWDLLTSLVATNTRVLIIDPSPTAASGLYRARI